MMDCTRRVGAAVLVATMVWAGAAGASPPGPAPEPTRLIDRGVIADVRDILSEEIVALSVVYQNQSYGALSQGDIDRLDQRWRAEREEAVKPLITRRLSSPLSAYLTHVQAQSLGLFTEIFITDSNGLNVGQSAITSDYWQGDEAKFLRTFNEGPTAIFIDEAEWHDGSRTWRAQLNLTVADPNTNRPIGAATFEINLTELQRRAAS